MNDRVNLAEKTVAPKSGVPTRTSEPIVPRVTAGMAQARRFSLAQSL